MSTCIVPLAGLGPDPCGCFCRLGLLPLHVPAPTSCLGGDVLMQGLLCIGPTAGRPLLCAPAAQAPAAAGGGKQCSGWKETLGLGSSPSLAPQWLFNLTIHFFLPVCEVRAWA